jgi:hypothetical protein
MQQRVPKGANATASQKRAQPALEAKAEDYKRTKREGVSWRPPCIKKHGKKKSKRYAVQSEWKVHFILTCGTLFSRQI